MHYIRLPTRLNSVPVIVNRMDHKMFDRVIDDFNERWMGTWYQEFSGVNIKAF